MAVAEKHSKMLTCLVPIRYLLFLLFCTIGRFTSGRQNLLTEASVLSYHSIGSDNSFLTVNPKEFKRQMEYLRENFRVASLGEIIEFVKGKKNLPKRSIAITFDDGYHNIFSNAYPYLKKHNLPATVFVTTAYCQKKMPLGNVSLKMLSWNEIKKMSRNGMEIGAHTMTHPNLVEIDLKEAKNEILRSKQEIEDHTGRDCKYFAYPFYVYNEDVMNLVKTLGFEGGLGGIGSIRKGDNPFVLNRILIDGSVTFVMFKAYLTKAMDWYERARGRLSKKL